MQYQLPVIDADFWEQTEESGGKRRSPSLCTFFSEKKKKNKIKKKTGKHIAIPTYQNSQFHMKGRATELADIPLPAKELGTQIGSEFCEYSQDLRTIFGQVIILTLLTILKQEHSQCFVHGCSTTNVNNLSNKTNLYPFSSKLFRADRLNVSGTQNCFHVFRYFYVFKGLILRYH